MLRYQTKNDRLREVVAAIIPGTESETGRAIYIDLMTITDSNEENPVNYQIKHGNFFPDRYEQHPTECETVLVERATWDQFYINGKDDGFQDGFQTLDDVEQFLCNEVARIQEKKTGSVVASDFKSDGVSHDQWDRVLIAWKGFQARFLQAKRDGKLIAVDAAKLMRDSLIN